MGFSLPIFTHLGLPQFEWHCGISQQGHEQVFVMRPLGTTSKSRDRPQAGRSCRRNTTTPRLAGRNEITACHAVRHGIGYPRQKSPSAKPDRRPRADHHINGFELCNRRPLFCLLSAGLVATFSCQVSPMALFSKVSSGKWVGDAACKGLWTCAHIEEDLSSGCRVLTAVCWDERARPAEARTGLRHSSAKPTERQVAPFETQDMKTCESCSSPRDMP
jgi:hypothetical protein